MTIATIQIFVIEEVVVENILFLCPHCVGYISVRCRIAATWGGENMCVCGLTKKSTKILEFLKVLHRVHVVVVWLCFEER